MQPTINEQEHLLDELKKPTLLEQVRIFEQKIKEADKYRAIADNYEYSFAEIQDLIERESTRLLAIGEKIEQMAYVNISPRAYLMWKRKHKNRMGPILLRRYKNQTPEEIEERRRKMEENGDKKRKIFLSKLEKIRDELGSEYE